MSGTALPDAGRAAGSATEPFNATSWGSFGDAEWARLNRAAFITDPRLKSLAMKAFGSENPWSVFKGEIPAPERAILRASRDTPLRTKGGVKRLVLAIAGSGWGKTTFLEGARNSGLKVCDIDDLLIHDAKAAELRKAGVAGEIPWAKVNAYTHSQVRDKLLRFKPDVLLNHSPFEGSMPWLANDFAVEEWRVTPPPLSEVVRRVRERAGERDADKAELIARVNYGGLKVAKPSKRAIAQEAGSWTQLWNRLLVEYVNEKRKTVDGGLGLEIAAAIGGCYEKRAARVAARAAELGALGSFLKGKLKTTDLIDRRSIDSDVMTMGRIRGGRGELAVCAYSLLCMDFPVQTVANRITIRELIDAAVAPLPTTGRPEVDILNKEQRRANYPLKDHPGASNKVNVYANEVYSKAMEMVPTLCDNLRRMTAYQEGFSDDQLSATVISAVIINPYVNDAASIATRLVRDPKGAKTLSNAIKSLGLNVTDLGAMVCEAECLQGRGVGVPDKMSDAGYRVGGAKLEEKLHNVDEGALRQAIRKVLERECPRTVEFEEPEKFWRRRWQWCVNGAHSRLIERLHPGLVPHEPALKARQVHRRVFAERLVWEPVTGWDGKSYFSLSLKLECGKTRFIYSGDSLTYFAFEHLMKPVERGWKNMRAILDPGALGTWKIGKRIRAMRKWGSVNVMLDYDDFNSRHRLEYMQMVIEELVKHVDYPQGLAEKLISSITNQHLLVDGEEVGVLQGTLMSGHRCTTFFNTVLNEAYIRVAYDDLDALKSMHVGDDVYICTKNYDQAQEILDSCKRVGLAMNPLKQSVGVYAAEFLRVCYGERCARGYACRSVATCVNGNWTSEVRLSAEEGLKSVVGHSWTLCNRATNAEIGALLVSSVKRICKLSSKVARDLLTGRGGLADGPARATGLSTKSYHLKVDTRAEQNDVALATYGLSQYATRDYLTYCATPLERYILRVIGGKIVSKMRCASYRKTMISSPGNSPTAEPADVRVTRKIQPVRTTVQLEEAGRGNSPSGVLAKFPLLQLVKGSIKGELLHQALIAEGVAPSYTQKDVYTAWGRQSRALAFMGAITYSDASSLCSRCDQDLVVVNYPCFA